MASQTFKTVKDLAVNVNVHILHFTAKVTKDIQSNGVGSDLVKSNLGRSDMSERAKKRPDWIADVGH